MKNRRLKGLESVQVEYKGHYTFNQGNGQGLNDLKGICLHH